MSTVEKHRSPVYRQLEAYEGSWQSDHAEAMACRVGEDAIEVGLSILHMLETRADAWRDQVFRGVIPYSEEDNLDHQHRFAAWLDTTKKILSDIVPELEKRFGTVEGAAKLRTCTEHVEKITSRWLPPRLSMSVGLLDMTLSREAGAELDRILEQARLNPPARIESPIEVKDASFLNRPANTNPS